MALSKAKKARQKLAREGVRNPESNRLSWNGLVPVERKTPTRLEITRRTEQKHKKKWNLSLDDSGRFHF
jgi:hypothetical protein